MLHAVVNWDEFVHSHFRVFHFIYLVFNHFIFWPPAYFIPTRKRGRKICQSTYTKNLNQESFMKFFFANFQSHFGLAFFNFYFIKMWLGYIFIWTRLLIFHRKCWEIHEVWIFLFQHPLALTCTMNLWQVENVTAELIFHSSTVWPLSEIHLIAMCEHDCHDFFAHDI